MQQILHNLAMLDALAFCKEHKIDCSGTHLVKYPGKFTYGLVRDKDNVTLVETTFHKSSVPTHAINLIY